VWERKGCRAKWIVKPPALARGTGITVINKWSQVGNQFLVVVVLMSGNV
jgi:tubulin polyglutamylase TTLL4